MTERITGRGEILISDTTSPDRLSAIRNYCVPDLKVTMVGHCADTGLMDLDDLKLKLNPNVAGLYFENPGYLGVIEHKGEEISRLIHENGSLVVVGVDPISLGSIKPPTQYGADISCGDVQGLGVRMYYGGALGGFIATKDEEKLVMEFPSRLFGVSKTIKEGEWGFGDVAYDRTSFGVREKGKEFVGTAAALWGITAAVYLSLMGPWGMVELNQVILQKSLYAQQRLSRIKGVKAPRFGTSHFKEFVVDFSRTGRSVAEINSHLLEQGIFGGKDLSDEFSRLKDCALYCVTEVLSKDDIDFLVDTLEKFLG